MINNFFVLSPRGDTILAKQYRNETHAHERSHTEALFRKIKFWDDDEGDEEIVLDDSVEKKRKGDAPPIILMPDGLAYLHVRRNGLIFGASTSRNASPHTILEVGKREAPPPRC